MTGKPELSQGAAPAIRNAVMEVGWQPQSINKRWALQSLTTRQVMLLWDHAATCWQRGKRYTQSTMTGRGEKRVGREKSEEER